MNLFDLQANHDTALGGITIDKARFVVPLDRHWHVYRARLAVPGGEACALSVVIGPEPVDTNVAPYGWINDTGARANIRHTLRVDPTVTGLNYDESLPRLYFPPAATFWTALQPDTTFSIPQWYLTLSVIETAEPLTNW